MLFPCTVLVPLSERIKKGVKIMLSQRLNLSSTIGQREVRIRGSYVVLKSEYFGKL